MGFSRQNIGVGSHFLLQEISPTQGSNLDLPHRRQILCHLSLRKAGVNNHSPRELVSVFVVVVLFGWLVHIWELRGHKERKHVEKVLEGLREKAFPLSFCCSPPHMGSREKPIQWQGKGLMNFSEYPTPAWINQMCTKLIIEQLRVRLWEALVLGPPSVKQFLFPTTQFLSWECFQWEIMQRRCTIPRAVKEAKPGSLLVGGR